MFAQRVVQASGRRLVAQRPASAITKFSSPAAVATSSLFVQRRQAATTTTAAASSSSSDILIKQRLNRPVAPHLSIYQPQITWYLSMLHRLTGLTLSGGLYVYGLAYLIGPTVGWHLESSVMAASFAAWPIAAKIATKTLIAFPFVFHSFNGVRHLVWDMGWNFAKSQVNRSGWLVVGLTVIGSTYLGFFY